MRIFNDIFNDIISLENLFLGWDKFKKGKQKKPDVQYFEYKLEKNIFALHRDLKNKKYKHGPYVSFCISDPKPRQAHKATVRDRVVHHAIFRIINPIFEPTFISNSFSCRVDKGTHKGVITLDKLTRKVSKNNTCNCFVLKCDIKKFFGTINHRILIEILSKRIKDGTALWLLGKIINSFDSSRYSSLDPSGLPIGNLTSQLFANIYLNEFDQFIKHKLKIKHYLRYTDDFIVVAKDRSYLENIVRPINSFLNQKLLLELHPDKLEIRKFHQGIDFLGYITLPHYRLLRTKTKKRIFKKLKNRIKEYKEELIGRQTLNQSLQSYLGLLSHANNYELGEEIKNQFYDWLK